MSRRLRAAAAKSSETAPEPVVRGPSCLSRCSGVSMPPAVKSAGDGTTLPRPPAQEGVISAWLSSSRSPPPVSDLTGEEGGDGGMEATLLGPGGDASRFGTAGRAREMGLRLRLPVLLRRLLFTGDGGVTAVPAVPAAAVMASSASDERSPEGGGVTVPVTSVAEVAGSGVSDTEGTVVVGRTRRVVKMN